jgi:hypothetical protein
MRSIVYGLICAFIIFAIIVYSLNRPNGIQEPFTVIRHANDNQSINSMDFKADYPVSDSYINQSRTTKLAGELSGGISGGTVGRYPPIPLAYEGTSNEIVGHTDIDAPIEVRGRSIRGGRTNLPL